MEVCDVGFFLKSYCNENSYEVTYFSQTVKLLKD